MKPAESADDVRRQAAAAATLDELSVDSTTCRACPRLVAWREEVARVKRRSFADEPYWGRPIPGWGDEQARIAIVGLAPAAHGGNRTGRIFTGDRSGDWLFAALYRAGLAAKPTSVRADDGQQLIGVRMVAAVRCAPPANKPTTDERDTCRPWLVRELELLAPTLRVIVVLGGFGWQALAAESCRCGVRLAATAAALRPRCASRPHGRRTGRIVRDRLLSPEPAEHLHRQAHRGHARRRAGTGEKAGPDRLVGMADRQRPHILIVGGGYVGMYTALRLSRRLRRDEAMVTVIDPLSYMTYQPFLPEAAAGNLEPRHVVVPLRRVLPHAQILNGRVTRIEHGRRVVTFLPNAGRSVEISYDIIVVAPGSIARTLPIPGLAENGIGFKTVGEAIFLRNHVLSKLDIAASTTDVAVRKRALTFVFVGGGYAGVEAMAELEDMARDAIEVIRRGRAVGHALGAGRGE